MVPALSEGKLGDSGHRGRWRANRRCEASSSGGQPLRRGVRQVFMRHVFLQIVLAVSMLAAAQASPIFIFHTDGFWLNLHSFLYVLGRDQSGAADRTRQAVAGAPADQATGVATMSPADAKTWRGAVTTYATGLSKRDAVFDEGLVAVTNALSQLNSSALLPSSLPVDVRATLEQAAPIYRKVWWPAHEQANRAWVEAVRPLVNQHGPTILAFITKAYAAEWPSAGYPICVSAYANWAGAYSTSGNLIVMGSLDSSTRGADGLEIAFHESMHQWDEAMNRALTAAAKRQGKTLRPNLSHAMIFFTAGEAVRRVIPAHVPYADTNGIWDRGFAVFKPALEAAWRPWLDGRTSRDVALGELVRQTARAPEASRLSIAPAAATTTGKHYLAGRPTFSARQWSVDVRAVGTAPERGLGGAR